MALSILLCWGSLFMLMARVRCSSAFFQFSVVAYTSAML